MSLNKTQRFSRHTFGDNGYYGRRNVVSVSFAATDLKKPQAASGNALLAATSAGNGGATTLTPTAQPDIPRNITLAIAATTATDIAASAIVITGTNVEGKTITESLTPTADTPGTLTGSKAFKTVTSVAVPQQDGASVTVAIGYGAKLGIGLRSLSTSAIKVLTNNAGTEALENASASALSSSAVESNTVTPTTTPDGTIEMRVYVLNYNWHINPTNAQPTYGV